MDNNDIPKMIRELEFTLKELEDAEARGIEHVVTRGYRAWLMSLFSTN